MMPGWLRDTLNTRLELRNIGNLAQLEQALEGYGYRIAKAPPAGAGGLERRLELVRLATRQARQVMRGKGDSGEMSEALLRLMQQHLFAVLVELEPSGAESVKLESIARTVAQLARASLMNRKYAEELEARMAERSAAEAQLAALLRDAEGGLKGASDEQIRRVLMGTIAADKADEAGN